MAFKNFVAGQVLGESDLDDYLMEQTVMVFATAAARDTALSGIKQNGTLTYQQDTKKYTAWDGLAWWTVGQATGFGGLTTTGAYLDQNGSVAFTVPHWEYTVVNGVCDLWFRLQASASGSAGTAVYVGLPVEAANDSRQVGAGTIYDASTGFLYTGVWEVVSGFPFRISMIPAGSSITGYWGVTPSIGLASGDQVIGHVRFVVETAA